MKKVTALCLSLGLVVAFFCFPVNAASTGSPAVHKNASTASQGVTAEITMDQYYPVINAESGTYGAAETYTFVYYRLTNSNDQAAYVRNTGFTPQWVNAPYITGYETYSDNLYLGYQGNSSGTWWVYGDGDYSYSNGVVVPPHSSLYCIGYIKTANTVNGNTVAGTALSSVSINSLTVALGDYPYGTNGQQLSEIESIMNQMLAELQFSGTITPPAQADYLNHSKAFQSTGFYSRFFITRQPSFMITEDTEILSSTDYYQNGYKVIPIYYRVRTDNQYTSSGNNMTLKFDYTNLYTPLYLPKVSGVSYIAGDCVSQVFMDPILDQTDSTYVRVQMPFKYTEDGHGLLPYGNYFSSFVIYCICPVDVTPVFPASADWVLQSDNTFTAIQQGFYLQDTFYLRAISIDLAEIKQYLLEQDQDLNDKADDVADDSATVTEQIEYVHQQEMAFFEANEDAIEATGLSNFHYNQNTISAFTMITNQFASVWNALSDYTLVFIFTLLLSLATFIIRHEPTTKMKQYRTSVAAERAERISYYGRMNAQSRASARNDGDSYFWDAVRRNNM